MGQKSQTADLTIAMLDVRLPDGATGDITVFGAHLAAASRDWGKEAGASAQRLFDSARPLCYAALSIVGLYVCYTVVVGMHRGEWPRAHARWPRAHARWLPNLAAPTCYPHLACAEFFPSPLMHDVVHRSAEPRGP